MAYTGGEVDWAVRSVRQRGRGRVFYCSLGGDWRSCQDPAFLRYLLSGIQFAIGDLPGETAASVEFLLPRGADPRNLLPAQDSAQTRV